MRKMVFSSSWSRVKQIITIDNWTNKCVIKSRPKFERYRNINY